MTKILITGCAGFIGYHLANALMNKKKLKVFGIDNLNSYYDVDLKYSRLLELKNKNKITKNFKFNKLDITKKKLLINYFKKNNFDCVINLAAQAGVRHSIEFPESYLDNNIIGFFNILEASRKVKLKHLLFASTSSVYGANKKYPFNESDSTDNPESFYAATKKSNETMAYAYSSIYNIPITGLRFFTVYGPYGRPDMALFKFTELILKARKIPLFNNGHHVRDFTYVDDVVTSIVKLINKPPKTKVPYDIFNVASANPLSLKKFLSLIERRLEKKARVSNKPFQKGDVYKTFGSIKKLINKINYKPQTTIKKGIENFIDWYLKSFK
ncbi:GDP-mannose 4,6-dehydratase [Acinetobacter sp.]|uniref:GDP-mannose 4,6-dehydratase n=1 Tax=Acinetobacter sp. TaxID=472 RepID=UPI000C3F1EF4|nr:GDP-mannose 4,6-dehydratase [Acinetobacter sp.]MBC70017.1 hypothetical protein [Acinetobacter sp.]|tara:strand:+ start:129 stop:1109 length:981 start_codon:yes stop_codon:yes gene_type:complete